MNINMSKFFGFLLSITTMLATVLLFVVLNKNPTDLALGVAFAAYFTYLLFAGVARTLLAIRERIELQISLAHPDAFAEEEKKRYW